MAAVESKPVISAEKPAAPKAFLPQIQIEFEPNGDVNIYKLYPGAKPIQATIPTIGFNKHPAFQGPVAVQIRGYFDELLSILNSKETK